MQAASAGVIIAPRFLVSRLENFSNVLVNLQSGPDLVESSLEPRSIQSTRVKIQGSSFEGMYVRLWFNYKSSVFLTKRESYRHFSCPHLIWNSNAWLLSHLLISFTWLAWACQLRELTSHAGHARCIRCYVPHQGQFLSCQSPCFYFVWSLSGYQSSLSSFASVLRRQVRLCTPLL